jgi:flagellar hook-associated protein 1 FlgK
MSLSIALSNAASGLRTAQTGLRVTSDNIANVDNPRYVRKVADQQSVAAGGSGAGVEISQIRRVTDRFLQAAGLHASSAAAQAGVTADLMDQVQGLFGLPTEPASLSSSMQSMFAGFTSLAGTDPTTSARAGALNGVSNFFDKAAQFGSNLQSIVGQAETRARDDVARVNVLLTNIASYNREIAQGFASGVDITGLQQRQSEMIDELGGMIDIRVQQSPMGSVVVRAFDGRDISSMQASSLSIETIAGQKRLVVHTEGSPPQDVTDMSDGGSIAGHLDFVNVKAPAIEGQLLELTAQTATELNRIHNLYSAVPPPGVLTGKDTGGTLDAVLAGLSGTTSIGLVDATGAMTTTKVDIVFGAGTTGTVNGVAFTDQATFLTELNTALAPASASFTAGRLTINGGGSGVVTTSSPAAGTQGFSQAFGLNDLLVGAAPGYTVRPDILASPQKLGLALPDLSGPVGPAPVVYRADQRGADALGNAGGSLVNFNPVGWATGGVQSLNDYLTSFGANIARVTNAAETAKGEQTAISEEANARRASIEGVNLDEELVSLTSYQQAYNASTRVMQAVSEMYDALLAIMN